MIKQITDNNIFLEICDKLKEVRDCELKESFLYGCMVGGLYNKKVFTFASYDEDKMNGCFVLSLSEMNSEICLNILFVWIDKHYPEIYRECMEFTEEKAREFKIRKIFGITKRNAEAIERKFGKYGYKKVYSVIIKEVI